MRRLPLLLLAFLTMLSLTTFADMRSASAALCTDGQSMEGRGACTCRPPLKFLPGNICGSGKKAGTQPNQPGVAPIRGIQCKPGQNTASGCNCTGELILFPGGVCNYRVSSNAACREGMDPNGSQKCVCKPPLKIIENGICGRLFLNETRPLQKQKPR